VIRLSNISYCYPGTAGRRVLEGINLSIHEGEYVLICGRSGSGKSTLGYLFNGLIPHFLGGELQGSVHVNGTDTREVTIADLIRKVGLVFQNADAQLFNSTVENEIAFGLESLGLTARKIEGQIDSVVETLGIGGLLHRSPMSLSGGEKRIVAIASVLCLDPPLLLLDEPFAHLDWQAARKLRDALSKLHRKGKTVVIIEQRVRSLIEDVSRCIVVEQGKILYDGMPDEAHSVLNSQHLLPCYQQRNKTERKMGEPILSVENLTCKQEGREILKGMSFEVRKGESLAIVGRNGSGKTTLIKHLNGLRRPGNGSVKLSGMNVSKMSSPERATRAGICFQNPNDQFFKNRVREELLVGARVRGPGEQAAVEEISALFELKDLLERSPYKLSEGQKKRVAFASIAAMRPEILVVDEPTVGQDGRFLETISRLVRSLQEQGQTIIIVTHDLEFAQATTERWIVLHEGKVVGDGSPEKLYHDQELIRMGAIEGAHVGVLAEEVRHAISPRP
jgi:energy-coupling factor transporter ATP-binding protein EcfA2